MVQAAAGNEAKIPHWQKVGLCRWYPGLRKTGTLLGVHLLSGDLELLQDSSSPRDPQPWAGAPEPTEFKMNATPDGKPCELGPVNPCLTFTSHIWPIVTYHQIDTAYERDRQQRGPWVSVKSSILCWQGILWQKLLNVLSVTFQIKPLPSPSSLPQWPCCCYCGGGGVFGFSVWSFDSCVQHVMFKWVLSTPIPSTIYYVFTLETIKFFWSSILNFKKIKFYFVCVSVCIYICNIYVVYIYTTYVPGTLRGQKRSSGPGVMDGYKPSCHPVWDGTWTRVLCKSCKRS